MHCLVFSAWNFMCMDMSSWFVHLIYYITIVGKSSSLTLKLVLSTSNIRHLPLLYYLLFPFSFQLLILQVYIVFRASWLVYIIAVPSSLIHRRCYILSIFWRQLSVLTGLLSPNSSDFFYDVKREFVTKKFASWNTYLTNPYTDI